MELVVANLEPRCCGKVTWCARGSATFIDYALVSAGLNNLLRHIDIDEKGLHSLGSDHNHLLLEFNCSGSSVSHNRCRKKQGKYLPSQAVSDVVDEFEKSALRGQAGTYDDFVAALFSVMQKHMVWEKRRTRVVRKPWWDAEVKTAAQARREANRRHRILVKKGDNEACLTAWTEYLDLKHKLQALLKEHLTSHLLHLYGQAEGSKDGTQGEATHTHVPGPLPGELSTEGSGVRWRVSRGEIDRALKRISAHTASGLDGLPSGILKGFVKETKKQLAGLFTGIMEESPQELQDLINISQAEITRLGLRFNCKKSAVVPLASTCADGVTLRLGDEVLMVCTTYRYLVVQLSSGPDLYGQQEEIFRQKALRAQCILRRQCLCGCNRFVVVRDFWKIVHVPALTFANAVLCLSAVSRDWLERRQREVGRIALGCHGAVANEAVQGDVGWSSFEAREAVEG
ncbi:hypothetical protein HPB50_016912 [Hyalomma asiaticum]|uniref:Uncharacterized protein n=1 Tax=Hyalomma asiaticum TaxID=266040 RepID=A0ACB7TLT2_HYAAI|nr:hypothetical protein HPB50_016912 [Hyalomma asiaticum]